MTPIEWRIDRAYCEWFARGYSRQEGRKSSPWPTYSLGPFPTREDAERALALALLEGRFV